MQLLCHTAIFCCVFVYCDLNDRLPSVLHDISQCGKDFPRLLINGVIWNLIMLLSYYTHWQDILLHYLLPVLHFLYFLFLNKYKYPSTNCEIKRWVIHIIPIPITLIWLQCYYGNMLNELESGVMKWGVGLE